MSSHPIATPPRYMSQPLGAMPSRGPSGLRLPAFTGAKVPPHQGRVVICDTRHCPRPINSAYSSDQRTSPISLGGMVSPITCRCTVKKSFFARAGMAIPTPLWCSGSAPAPSSCNGWSMPYANACSSRTSSSRTPPVQMLAPGTKKTPRAYVCAYGGFDVSRRSNYQPISHVRG